MGYKNTQKVEHTRSEIHMMKEIRNGTHTDWGTNGVGLTLAEKYMVWNTHRVGHTRSETTHAEWNTHGGIHRVGYKRSGVQKWGSSGVGYSCSGTFTSTEWDTQIAMQSEWDTE